MYCAICTTVRTQVLCSVPHRTAFFLSFRLRKGIYRSAGAHNCAGVLCSRHSALISVRAAPSCYTTRRRCDSLLRQRFSRSMGVYCNIAPRQACRGGSAIWRLFANLALVAHTVRHWADPCSPPSPVLLPQPCVLPYQRPHRPAYTTVLPIPPLTTRPRQGHCCARTHC